MTTNTKMTFSVHYKKHLLLITSLLLVVLFTSLFVYKLTINVDENVSLESAMYVGSEMELRAAINNASPNTPTIIALDRDILLTGLALEIPRDKVITLVSDTAKSSWKLIGAANQETIYVAGNLTLKNIIVTHKSSTYGNNVIRLKIYVIAESI
jgi:hypothetical protein